MKTPDFSQAELHGRATARLTLALCELFACRRDLLACGRETSGLEEVIESLLALDHANNASMYGAEVARRIESETRKRHLAPSPQGEGS